MMKVIGGCSSSMRPLPTSNAVASLDDPTYKVGRLSVEERKEKIHRYMKKRNERNFSKKIKVGARTCTQYTDNFIYSDGRYTKGGRKAIPPFLSSPTN